MAEPRKVPWPAAPMVLATIAYARVLHGELQLDDFAAIAQNPAIKHLGTFVRELPVRWLAGGRPLTDLTFAVNYAAGRLEPAGYHAVNLGLHLVASALLWVLARVVARLAGSARPGVAAFWAAGLFAVHPLQTQAVSYVVQRAEVLSSTLYVAALLLLFAAERAGRTWRGVGAWLGGALCFALALGAKPIALTVPAAYLLVALAVDGTSAARAELTTWPRRLLLSAPLFAWSTLVASRIVGSIEGRPDAGFDIPWLSPRDYLLTQLGVLLRYIRLIAFPFGQSVDWQVPVSTSPADAAVLAAAAAVGLLIGAAGLLLRASRRATGPAAPAMRLAGLGILWFFLVLSVTSSVAPLADLMVEHRVYLASWGLFLAAAAGAERWASSPGRASLARAGGILLLCFLAALTWRRNAVWETREALWRDVVEQSPGSARARLSLGFALAEQGRYAEAIAQYEVGLPLASGVPKLQAQLLRNLGGARQMAGDPAAAASAYRLGLDLTPDDPELRVNMAIALAGAGDAAGAERWARSALEVAPDQPIAWNLLGVLRMRRGEWLAAMEALDRAAAVNPDLGEVHLNRAAALDRLGRAREACGALEEALRRRLSGPDRAAAEQQLAARCR